MTAVAPESPHSFRALAADLDGAGLDSAALIDVLNALDAPKELFNVGEVCRSIATLLERNPWLLDLAIRDQPLLRARPAIEWVAAASGYRAVRKPRATGRGSMEEVTRAAYRAFVFALDHPAIHSLRAVVLVGAIARSRRLLPRSRPGVEHLETVGGLLADIERGHPDPDRIAALSFAGRPGRLAPVWSKALRELKVAGAISEDRRLSLSAIVTAFDDTTARYLPAVAAAPAAPKPVVTKSPRPRKPRAPTSTIPVGSVDILRPRPRRGAATTKKASREATHWSELVDAQSLVGVGTELTGGIEQPARIEAAIAQGMAHQIRDQLLLSVHWNTLSDGEHRSTLDFAYADAEKSFFEGRREDALAATLIVLAGVCGRDLQTLLRSSYVVDGAGIVPGRRRDVFISQDGTWRHGLPEKESRYRPSETQLPLLRPVGSHVDIRLPARCAALLEKAVEHAKDRRPLRAIAQLLKGRVRRILGRYRAESGGRATVPRLRKTVARRLLAATGDVAATMLTLGDSFGLSTVGCNYYSARVVDLRRAFASVSDGSSSGVPVSDDERVGSRLCLRPESVVQFAAELRAGLARADQNAAKEGSALASIHNRLVVYTFEMFAAATGHRHTARVLKFTRKNLSFRGRSAVINDKETNDGHRGRLCATGSTWMEQLGLLLAHYDAIAKRVGPDHPLSVACKEARIGSGPLLFVVDETLKPCVATLDAIRSRLPSRWNLPWNALRHRWATEMRERGCPAEYVAAQLGHLELGIQPFGIESPTRPEDFLTAVGPLVDQMLASDGWVTVCGIARTALSPASLADLAFSTDLAGQEAALEKAERDLQRVRRRNIEKRRAAEENETRRAVEAAIGTIRPGVGAGSSGIELDAKAVAAMRAAVIADVTDDADRIEWRINALRAALRERRDAGVWKCPLPIRAFKVQVEPSPYIEDFGVEFDKWLALQDWFLRGVRASRSQALLLGLVLFDGYADTDALFKIARAVKRSTVSRVVPDALIVPLDATDPNAPSVVLRGATAMLATQILGSKTEARVPSVSDFSRWLKRVLPAHFTRDIGDDCLEPLLELAKVCARFSLSGVERAVRQRVMEAVPLSMSRTLDLLDHVPARRTNPPSPATEFQQASRPADTTPQGPVRIELYRRLRKILYVKSGKPKSFGNFGPALPVGTSEEAIRGAIIGQLEQLHALLDRTPTVLRGLVEYATHLTVHGTPQKKNPSPRTVYKYVIDIGMHLIRQFSAADLTLLAEEDFIERYVLVAPPDDDSGHTQLAEMLLYFHKFLVGTYGVDTIDSRELLPWGHRDAAVDANVITVAEYMSARAALIERVETEARSGDLAARRVSLAALIVLILGWRSSCRLSEACLRRFSDLVEHDGVMLLLIRPNQFGRLKSLSSQRVCALHDRVDDAEIGWIRRWVEEQKTALGDRYRKDLPLFAELDDPRTPIDRALIGAIVNAVLRWSSGIADARGHWMRHAGASYDVLFTMADDHLVQSIPANMRDALHRSLGSSESYRRAVGGSAVLAPRHLHAIRYRRGHHRFLTTARSYVHILAIVAAVSGAESLLRLERTTIAALAGVSYSNFRKMLERSDRDAEMRHRAAVAILDRLHLERDASGTEPEDWRPIEVGRPAMSVSPRALECFLSQLASGIRWERAVCAHALSLNLQRGVCVALAGIYRDWPQSWFSKEQLSGFASHCEAEEALLALEFASKRRTVIPARTWLDKSIVDRASAALRDRSTSIGPQAVIDRRRRLAFFPDVTQLMHCCRSLMDLGLSAKRLALVAHPRVDEARLRKSLVNAAGPAATDISIARDASLGQSTRACAGVGLTLISNKTSADAPNRRHVQTLERILVLERVWGIVRADAA